MIFYAFIPALSLIVGAALASVFPLRPTWRSTTQHFAAGVVFAAVAVELLPHITHANPYLVACGFILGVLLMLLAKNCFSSGLLSAVGIDITIDGLLIGIAFEAGKRGGDLITTALSIEILFLGLSTAASLKQVFWKKIGTCIVLSLLIPLGYWAGRTIWHLLPSETLTAVIAFGVAALLYLVTEELLKEAHEVKDTAFTTTSFFAGFLLILLIS